MNGGENILPTLDVTENAEEDELSLRPKTSYLFVILRSDAPCAPPSRHDLYGISQIFVGRGKKRQVQRDNSNDSKSLSLFFPQKTLSKDHFSITKQKNSWMLSDCGSRNGTKINGSKENEKEIKDGDIIEAGGVTFIIRENLDLRGKPDHSLPTNSPTAFRTILPQLERSFQMLSKIALSKTTIYIHGPTGCGKEILANTIHAISGRNGKMVPINCGALPHNLVESELFGFRKGAFSGADKDSPGLILASNGGTLFLDEIGELPLQAQTQLLRVLEEGKVRPIGATQAIDVDLRVLCASHKDIEAMVQNQSFREDLFARLMGYAFKIPALNQRKEDLGVIISSLLKEKSAEDLVFSETAAQALFQYDWPRNIRELSKTLDLAISFCDQEPIELQDLPEVIQTYRSQPEETSSTTDRSTQLIQLLMEHNGNISAVSRTMGKPRSQIQRWLKKFRIIASDYRKDE